MLAHAVLTTSGLVALAVGTKMWTSDGHAVVLAETGIELVRRAIDARDRSTAVGVDEPTRLQHLSAASAYIRSARIVQTDEELERHVGESIGKLARRIDRDVRDARKKLQGK